MPTTGIVNGTLIYLDIGGTAVSCETTSSLNVSRGFRETVCKDDAPFGQKLPAKIDWSVDVQGYVKFDGSLNHKDLLDDLLAGTALTITYGTQVTGDPEFTGSAYLSDVSITAQTEESAEFSATLSGTGTLTSGTAA